MNEVYRTAMRYSEAGLCCIPLEGKRPTISWRQYRERRSDNSELWEFFGEAQGVNVGIVTGDVSGNLLVLDWDDPDAHEDWASEHQDLSDTIVVETGSGGRHTYYRIRDGKGLSTQQFFWNGKGARDMRFNGGQVVAPPSIHLETGKPYRWLNPDVPILTISTLEVLGVHLRKSAPCPEIGRLAMTPRGERNSQLNTSAFSGGQLVGAGLLDRTGVEQTLTSTVLGIGLGQREIEGTIRSGMEAGMAKPRTPPEDDRRRSEEDTPSRVEDGIALETHLTDLGNAKRLVGQHGLDLRYVYPWACWLVWDGSRWARDTSGEVERRAKATVATIYAEAACAGDAKDRKRISKHAQSSEATYRLKAMLESTRSEPGIPIPPESLDRDPWLLNVMNGTLDLRTGELLDHRRENLMTKIAPVHYDPHAIAPLWDAFLERVTNGNQNLIGFLQRAIGYALTGSTREQVLFILYGTGANGKTTFLQTISAMLGEDYSQQAPVEAVLVKRHGTIPNDLARMRGARFVSTIEVEDERRLAESLVKAMTGGDKIVARFLHREWFEFVPTFKLFVGTNHKPTIRGTDHAIWRRIRLIPFTVTIPEDEQDKNLPERLLAEFPGILRWALEGCQAWQKDGLGEPSEVTEATASYRAEMDLLGTFLEDCCLLDSTATVRAGKLHEAYQRWGEVNGEPVISATAFGRCMIERGFDRGKDARGRYYKGIGLLSEKR